jgi:hypothetical protein
MTHAELEILAAYIDSAAELSARKAVTGAEADLLAKVEALVESRVNAAIASILHAYEISEANWTNRFNEKLAALTDTVAALQAQLEQATAEAAVSTERRLAEIETGLLAKAVAASYERAEALVDEEHRATAEALQANAAALEGVSNEVTILVNGITDANQGTITAAFEEMETKILAKAVAASAEQIAAIPPTPAPVPTLGADEVGALVTRSVADAVAAIPPAVPGKDAPHLQDAVIDQEGRLVLMLSDGTTKQTGRIMGRDGEDGAATRDEVKDLVAATVGETLEAAILKAVTEAVDALPRMEYREVWRPQVTDYRKGNVVTFGGHAWVLKVDGSREKPDEGSDWQLMVRKGRDARGT